MCYADVAGRLKFSFHKSDVRGIDSYTTVWKGNPFKMEFVQNNGSYF